MDTPSGQGYSPFGQPLVKLLKGIEAYHISGDQKPSKKPLHSAGCERGSGLSSSPEDISASECTMEYLADLIKEKRQLGIFPQLFPNMERLIDQEISRVRTVLFQCNFSIEKVNLPEPEGEPITVQEKVYVPCKEYPDYNFVGRILGPRGMTAKQLEQETGCKIMVRGRGSMRDRRKEEQNRGKPNWEHLDDDLHVLIQCEDTPNRVYLKLKIGVEQIKKLLVPTQEGADELKRKQLMELAIINGTYRPIKHQMQSPQLVTPVTLVSPIRQPPASLPAQPIFISPVGSPITPAGNIGNAPGMNSFMQSPNIDYNMLMNQLSFDAAVASLTAGNAEYQPQTPPFSTVTSLINATSLPNPLQSYLVDSATITPPASTGSDRR